MIAKYPNKPVNAAFDIGTPFIRYISAADKEDFDNLYTKLRKIEEIANRATRDGQRSYKSALVKIIAICQGIG